MLQQDRTNQTTTTAERAAHLRRREITQKQQAEIDHVLGLGNISHLISAINVGIVEVINSDMGYSKDFTNETVFSLTQVTNLLLTLSENGRILGELK